MSVCNGFKNHQNGTTDTDDQNGGSYETLLQTAKYIQSHIPCEPKVGIICGSGMGSLAEALENKIVIPYHDIPNFPVSTVEGHAGQLVFGTLSKVFVVCMQGRFHYYEGYPLWKCAMPIRVMKLIGVEFLIATNAAGGINTAFMEGDVMLIKDHINMMGFAGNNPLQGPNDIRWGPRFPPMNKAYDTDLINQAKQIWKQEELKGRLFDGVYTCLGGPNFETVAELRMLKLLGVDAVGMSTVHEVLTARHCDMTVLAFSLITNVCLMDYHDHDNMPTHEEVMDVGKIRQGTLKLFVEKIVAYIAENRLMTEAADFILEKLPQKPKIGIICGKTFGALANMLQDKIEIPCSEIPHYPEFVTDDHSASVTYGMYEDVPMICFNRRFYVHEGGQLVILTNSVGAINPDYSIGDVIVLKDHINMVGFSGNDTIKLNDKRWGPAPTVIKYKESLREKALEAFRDSGFAGKVHEGIYVCSAGSKFQTAAETNLLKSFGCDVVGTSITHETIAAAQCGIDVMAVSLVQSICSTSYQRDNVKEDLDVTLKFEPFFKQYIKTIARDLEAVPTEKLDKSEEGVRATPEEEEPQEEKTEETKLGEEQAGEETPEQERPEEEKPEEEKPEEETPEQERPEEEQPEEAKPEEETPEDKKPADEEPDEKVDEEKLDSEKPEEEKLDEGISAEQMPPQEKPLQEKPPQEPEERELDEKPGTKPCGCKIQQKPQVDVEEKSKTKRCGCKVQEKLQVVTEEKPKTKPCSSNLQSKPPETSPVDLLCPHCKARNKAPGVSESKPSSRCATPKPSQTIKPVENLSENIRQGNTPSTCKAQNKLPKMPSANLLCMHCNAQNKQPEKPSKNTLCNHCMAHNKAADGDEGNRLSRCTTPKPSQTNPPQMPQVNTLCTQCKNKAADHEEVKRLSRGVTPKPSQTAKSVEIAVENYDENITSGNKPCSCKTQDKPPEILPAKTQCTHCKNKTVDGEEVKISSRSATPKPSQTSKPIETPGAQHRNHLKLVNLLKHLEKTLVKISDREISHALARLKTNHQKSDCGEQVKEQTSRRPRVKCNTEAIPNYTATSIRVT
ncbi:Phosphorylase superfamily [Popillia japonica]|uniref:Purine nucleoside phosphorylase n=1 Tax=Popillia japonica TaxID=7064 RepID=A0AAW1JJ64_POPJA